MCAERSIRVGLYSQKENNKQKHTGRICKVYITINWSPNSILSF